MVSRTLGAVPSVGEILASPDRLLRPSTTGGTLGAVPPVVGEVLSSPGQPLKTDTRTAMKASFGVDFGGVRVHTDARAAESARAVQASAYTVGRDVVFAAGHYAPETPAGRQLLAHELTHVVQQRGHNEERPPAPSLVGEADNAFEREADRIAGKGQRLLAHEIAHVIQQPTADPGVLQRQPSPKPRRRHSGPVDWKPGMRATLVADVVAARDKHGDVRALVKAGTLVEVVANPGFGFIEVQPVDPKTRTVDPKARTKQPLQVDDLQLEPVGLTTPASATGSPAGVTAVPVMLQYELLGTAEGGPEPSSGTGWGAAATRSTAIGAARGLGYLISPPVRSTLDPLLPLASRLSPPSGPLGVTGEVATLERYLTSPARELTPRYVAESAELFMRQSHGESWWLNNFGLTERQLGEMRGLVARMAKGGIESLAPAEQQLIMTFLHAHAESVAAPGLKIASPALSTTARQGLSALPEAAPFFRDAPYVVRIQVPADAVLEVNAAMGAKRTPGLVYELEMLVFTDARGAITSVQPNPVSTLGRATPTLRWVGRGFIVIGIGVSATRIATATPEELPRVIGEEGGGWLGGAGGSALGATACIAFGIATEGLGLFLCGAIGGIGGGLGGSYLGGELGEGAGKHVRKSMETASEIFNPMIERAIWGNTPIPAMGYYPPRQFGQNPVEYEEEREREKRTWSSGF